MGTPASTPKRQPGMPPTGSTRRGNRGNTDYSGGRTGLTPGANTGPQFRGGSLSLGNDQINRRTPRDWIAGTGNRTPDQSQPWYGPPFDLSRGTMLHTNDQSQPWYGPPFDLSRGTFPHTNDQINRRTPPTGGGQSGWVAGPGNRTPSPEERAALEQFKQQYNDQFDFSRGTNLHTGATASPQQPPTGGQVSPDVQARLDALPPHIRQQVEAEIAKNPRAQTILSDPAASAHLARTGNAFTGTGRQPGETIEQSQARRAARQQQDDNYEAMLRARLQAAQQTPGQQPGQPVGLGGPAVQRPASRTTAAPAVPGLTARPDIPGLTVQPTPFVNAAPEIQLPGNQGYHALDTRAVPNMDNYQDDIRAVEQATFGRLSNLLNPGFDRDEARLSQDLANRGLPLGSAAHTQAVEDFRRNKANALENVAMQSVGAGRQEHGRLSALAAALQGQEFAQAQSEANRRYGMDFDRARFGQSEANRLFEQNYRGNQQQFDQRRAYDQLNLARQGQQFGQGQQYDTMNLARQGQQFNQADQRNRFLQAERDAAFNRSLQARRQGLQEMMLERQQPYNELANLLQRGVNDPGLRNFDQFNVQSPDLISAVNNYNNLKQQQANDGILGKLIDAGIQVAGDAASAWLAPTPGG